MSQEKIVEDIIDILDKAKNESKTKSSNDISESQTDNPRVKSGLMRYKKQSVKKQSVKKQSLKTISKI